MPDNNNNDQVLVLLGNIQGELRGIRELVHSSSESTNRRIDDLKDSMNKRIEDHQETTEVRFRHIHQQMNKKSALAGGGSGALVAALVEVVRALVR